MKLTIKEVSEIADGKPLMFDGKIINRNVDVQAMAAQILKDQDALEDMILELESRTGDKYRPLIEAKAALLPKE